MATLAQPVPQQDEIRTALGAVALPDGVFLHSIKLRDNHHGEPSIFVVYGLAENGESDDTRADLLVDVINRTLEVLAAFELPVFEYVNFVAA